MPDPLAPLRPGDSISKVFSAARQNALAHAARTVNGNLPVRWARRRRPKLSASLMVYNYNNYTVDRFNAIGCNWWHGTSADENTSTIKLWSNHLSYAHWAVAQEDIAPATWGRCIVEGLTLAWVHKRETCPLTNVWGLEGFGSRCDLHPTYSSFTGEDAYKKQQLHVRYHGAGRILRTTKDLEEDRELAVVLIEGVQPFHVVAKNTHGPRSNFWAYPCHMSAVDHEDAIRIAPSDLQTYMAVGCDDVYEEFEDYWSAYYCTRGTVTWSYHGEFFKVLDWPTAFPVRLENNYDYDTFALAKVKHTVAGTTYGDAFYVDWSPYDGGVTSGTKLPNGATINAIEGQMCVAHAPPFAGYKAYLDWGLFKDEPYGTIRMFSGVSITGDGPYRGWYWCNGSNGTPDLRDRFIVVAGNDYSVGATGGQAKHGGGTNDHAAHSFVGSLASTWVQSGTGASVINGIGTLAIGSNHGAGSTETDNRPPYYALAFAIRKQTP